VNLGISCILHINPWRLLFERCTLLALFLGLLVPASPLMAAASGGLGQPSRLLLPHQPAFFHLSADDSVTLDLGAHAGWGTEQSAELLIETSASDADITVLAPDGRPFHTYSAVQPGWLAVLIPLVGRNRYQLLLRAESVQNGGSGISLHLDFLPFSTVEHTHTQPRTQAEELLSSAEALSRSPHSAPLRKAIMEYKQSAAEWAAAGNREGQLLALACEARTWLDLSEYANALAALDRARLLSLQMPWFRAWLDNLEAEVYLDRWDSERAMRFAREAARLSRDLADPWLTADAFAGRGEAEYLTGNSAALADIEQAMKLSRENDADETLARALRCKSWMESDEGRVTHALVFMRMAEEQFRNVGQVRNSIDALANLATIQRMNGDDYAALIRQSSIVHLMQDSGKLSDLGFLFGNIGHDYMALNRSSDAIAYYGQSVEIFRKIGLISGESINMSALCMAETSANRLQAAMRDCLQSKTIAEQLHDPKRIAVTIWRLGKVQRTSGKTKEAIASFRRAFEISAGVHDPYSEAQSLIDWGDTLEILGDSEKALDLFARALPLSVEAEYPPMQLEVRYRIARSEFEAGKMEDARRDLTLALNSIDAQRRSVRNPDLQASYFAQVRKCHELFVELLMREHERNPSIGSDMQALEVSESGRALTLLDTLTARGNRSAAWRSKSEPQEQFEMRIAVERAYDQRLQLMLEGGHKSNLDANEAVLTRAIDTLERAEDEQKSSAGNASAQARPLSTAQIIAASRALHSTLVEYALGDRQSYVWVIDGGKVESHVLPARSVIESAVRKWRELATARVAQSGETFDAHRRRVQAADAELSKVAARLSCMLLAPVLQPHMKQLAIVPDGSLNLLPFAALPESSCQGGGLPIAAERQIVLAPSLSILLMPHPPPDPDFWRGEIALLADPVFDSDDPRVHRPANSRSGNDPAQFELSLSRLFGTRDEAKAIAALAGPERSVLYLDFDASLQTLLNPSLSRYRILHLATHGVLDENAPGLSGIVLSLVNKDGEPVFGYLRRHDVENLTVHSDLVVLSSCDSAAGLNLSGEGATGLNYAFLSAGATRVLSTLWSIDDETSKELMIAFYSRMLREGLDPVEALRRSQMKIMRNPSTAAPYYWAGFTITTTTP
jgi:CHAT domain-containing protein